MAPAPVGALPPGNMYNPPRPPEVYTLPDNIQEQLPEQVRQNFQHDTSGRVLFFTAPPLDRPHKGISEESIGLGHSAKYLAGRKEWLAERERKRKQRDESQAEESRKQVDAALKHTKDLEQEAVSQATNAMASWLQHFDQETAQWEKEVGLQGWERASRKNGVA